MGGMGPSVLRPETSPLQTPSSSSKSAFFAPANLSTPSSSSSRMCLRKEDIPSDMQVTSRQPHLTLDHSTSPCPTASSTPAPMSHLTPSLHGLADAGFARASGRQHETRSRRVGSTASDASTGSAGLAVRSPMQDLPSPTLDFGRALGDASGSWGSFASICGGQGPATGSPRAKVSEGGGACYGESVYNEDAIKPPKPQGKKTADFFASYASTSPPPTHRPAASNSSRCSSGGELSSLTSPLSNDDLAPPSALRTPVPSVKPAAGWSRSSCASSTFSDESVPSLSRSPEGGIWGVSDAAAPTSDNGWKGRQAGFFNASPTSSRDPSPPSPPATSYKCHASSLPSLRNHRAPEGLLPAVAKDAELGAGEQPRKSRLSHMDGFSTSPTMSSFSPNLSIPQGLPSAPSSVASALASSSSSGSYSEVRGRESFLRTQLLHHKSPVPLSESPSRLPTLVPDHTTAMAMASVALGIGSGVSVNAKYLAVGGRPKLSTLPSVVLDSAEGSWSQVVAPSEITAPAEMAKETKRGTAQRDDEIRTNIGVNATEKDKGEADEEVRAGAVLSESLRGPAGSIAAGMDKDGATGYEVVRLLGEGAFSKVVEARRRIKACQRTAPRNRADQGSGEGGLVAVKMIARKAVDGNERMRSAVEREIGVLKHIRHPCLVSLITSFSTPHHTALVLDHVSGGELFDLLQNHHDDFTPTLVKRIFGELCGVVGWMHQIGAVHRDIKLENVLLTRQLFQAASSPSINLPPPMDPLIKLTDFGLSRFIDPSSPLLTTRCGSEEYAAPELLMGKAYDGRQTDVWALGVVGYALLCGWLPFGLLGGDNGGGSATSVGSGSSTRRGYLLKIVKAEYEWPEVNGKDQPGQRALRELVSPEATALIDGLLVRDPSRRLGLNPSPRGRDTVWTSGWLYDVKADIEALGASASGRRPAEGSEAARVLAGEH